MLRFRCGKHLIHMSRHLHLAPDLGEPAFRIDQEGGPLHPQIAPTVHALLHPDAVALAHRPVLIGGEHVGKAVLGGEFLVLFGAVSRYPHNDGAGGGELFRFFSEV